MLLMTALTLMSAAADGKPACSGDTTPAVEACLNATFAQEDDRRARYYEAALKRLREQKEDAVVVNGLIAAEQRWVAYRHTECSAVFEYWAAGTVRVAKEVQCRIALTRARTMAIWTHWLTYADRTPPILPRPPIEAGDRR